MIPKLLKFLRARFTREGAVGLYLTLGFVACAILVVLFAPLADEVFETPSTDPVDEAITRAIRLYQSPHRTLAARTFTHFGDSVFIFPTAAVIASVLWFRHRHVSGLLFAAAVLFGGLLEVLLKISFHRVRPALWPALVEETSPSFPSGHATLATAFWGGLVAVTFHMTRKRVSRAAALCFAVPMVLGVAATRVYLGAHWATDVLAGILVGLFWVVIAWTGTEYLARRKAGRAAQT
jgi:undecaprenyl-diphosphatase